MHVAEQTDNRLILQPRPQMLVFLILAVWLVVGVGMFGAAKRTTLTCSRDADGYAHCEYVENGLVGAKHRRFKLDQFAYVEFRKKSKGGSTAHLVTPDGEFNLGTKLNGDYEAFRSLLHTRTPGQAHHENDQRGNAFFALALLALGGFVGYQHTITTTLCFDRDENRVRVFFQGLFGKQVREVPYDQVAAIEVASNSKAMIQLAARLRGGGSLPLAPAMVAVKDKDAIAERLTAFLAEPVLRAHPDAPMPHVIRVTSGVVLTKEIAIAALVACGLAIVGVITLVSARV